MLEAFHIKCLQRILKVTRWDRVRHSNTLQRARCSSLETTMVHHQLRWLGHVVRMMPASRLPRKILYGQLHLGQRSAGGGGGLAPASPVTRSAFHHPSIHPSSILFEWTMDGWMDDDYFLVLHYNPKPNLIILIWWIFSLLSSFVFFGFWLQIGAVTWTISLGD